MLLLIWAHRGMGTRVIELDIKKCFDRIAHKTIMDSPIAPRSVKQGIFRCLKAGINPEFPEQGTPQGGVCSPLAVHESCHDYINYDAIPL